MSASSRRKREHKQRASFAATAQTSGSVQTAEPPALIAPPQASTPHEALVRRALKPGPLSILISVLALVVSGLSFRVATHQVEISQAAQDRAAGKVRARFEIVDLDNRGDESLREFIKEEVGSTNKVFRLDNPDDLLRWQPRITIKNVGDEIIDAVRVEVLFKEGRAYGFGVKEITPTPVVMSGVSSREIPLYGKLAPGQKATILLAPLLLDQMLRGQFEQYSDTDKEDFFEIRPYCRIVGAPAFDGPESGSRLTLHFHWRQTGFTERQKCEDIVKGQPQVLIK